MRRWIALQSPSLAAQHRSINQQLAVRPEAQTAITDVHVDHCDWILLDPTCQGRGLGSAMMERARARARTVNATVLEIAASHRSCAFFARFGAREVLRTTDGWGPGMHRVDMEMAVDGPG